MIHSYAILKHSYFDQESYKIETVCRLCARQSRKEKRDKNTDNALPMNYRQLLAVAIK
jgi:hypothetical protein